MRIPSFLLILTLATAIAPVRAQQPQAPAVDARWTAWLGCWQQLEETVRGDNLAEPAEVDAVPTRGVVVCVTPAADAAGVTLSTIVEKQFALEETVVADGSARTIDEPGCTGSQRAEWSANGRRVFARAELSCLDGTKRLVSGLSTMAPGPMWVDIQVVDAGGRESIRVRRYRRAPDQSHVSAQLSKEQLSQAARAAAGQATSFTLEEVKEASAKLAPSALEAGLIETRAQFPLNAKRLAELDAAGVPDRVLDLMIAVSFPNKFVVERRVSAPVAMPMGPSIFGPEWIDLGYDMFPYYYSPFGYGMWGRYDYGYYGGPIYYFGSSGGGGGGGEARPTEEGRVIDGLGYTRVRARDPIPVGGDGGAGGGGTVSSSGGASSGGGVTSQGYSGGGGGDSGRTAVARPPQ